MFPKDPLMIEKAIDELFRDFSTKALIARTMCRHKGEISKEFMKAIEEELKEKCSKEYKSLKSNLLSLCRTIETSLKEYFNKEHNKKIATIKAIEKLAETTGKDIFFVGDYPRSLVISGNVINVRDVEVFCETSLNNDVIACGAIPYNKSINNIQTYLKSFGAKDSDFNRYSFSRGITIDSLGLRAGTNEILDPTNRGITDSLKQSISSIIAPFDFVSSSPKLVFKAIKLATRTGFQIDNKLKLAIKGSTTQILNSISMERLVIESAGLSKSVEASNTLREIGWEDLL